MSYCREIKFSIFSINYFFDLNSISFLLAVKSYINKNEKNTPDEKIYHYKTKIIF